jgi:hypothetical protein
VLEEKKFHRLGGNTEIPVDTGSFAPPIKICKKPSPTNSFAWISITASASGT